MIIIALQIAIYILGVVGSFVVLYGSGFRRIESLLGALLWPGLFPSLGLGFLLFTLFDDDQ